MRLTISITAQSHPPNARSNVRRSSVALGWGLSPGWVWTQQAGEAGGRQSGVDARVEVVGHRRVVERDAGRGHPLADGHEILEVQRVVHGA